MTTKLRLAAEHVHAHACWAKKLAHYISTGFVRGDGASKEGIRGVALAPSRPTYVRMTCRRTCACTCLLGQHWPLTFHWVCEVGVKGGHERSRTGTESADICENDRVRLAAGHARAHLIAAEGRVEDVGVHCLLPHVYPLRPALVPAQLRLRQHLGLGIKVYI